MSSRKRNTKIHEFEVVLFPRRVWVTYDCPPAALDDMFPKEDGTKWPDINEDSDAEVWPVRRFKPDAKGGFLIRFSSKASMTPEVMAHESVHVAFGILNYIGETPDYEHQETMAYLVGLITDFCMQVKNFKPNNTNQNGK